MFHSIKLSDSIIANYTFAKIVQALLNPIEMIELKDIISRLGMAELVHFEVDEHLLSTEILYDKNDVFFLESIGRAICNSNQFELVIDVQKTQQKDLPFLIEPLSYMTLKEAEKLRDRIFKEDLEDIERDLLLASLNPERYKKVYEINEMETLNYWVARDKTSKQVIGLTGIYREKTDDKDECWLGWFCIDEKYRGKAFGKQLLEFSIEQAKKMQNSCLHVYTYKAKRFQKAIAMYRKYGFKEYQEEKDDARTMYLKMQLATKQKEN